MLKDLPFYLMLALMIWFVIGVPLYAARRISERFGPRQARYFKIVVVLVIVALVMLAWFGVSDSVRKGAWTAATLTPFITLALALPAVGGVTLLWVGALWIWERVGLSGARRDER